MFISSIQQHNIGCPQNVPLSHNLFFWDADSFSVIANIDQDNRPLFDTINQRLRLYQKISGVQKKCFRTKARYFETPYT